MARRKEEWITSAEAAMMLTEQSGHPVSARYVRLLGQQGHITTKVLDARTKLFLKSDVEDYVVQQRNRREEQAA